MAVKLAQNIFDKPAMEGTRDGFGKQIMELAEKDPKIICLSGDLNDSTRLDWLREKHPEKFIQAGIAEQNMVGMAAGLSLAGFTPYAATFGAFMFRAADHIRVSVAFNNLNVKLVATHCGVTTGEDGGNAQVLEDIAFFRALPNFKVIVPCDSMEARKATIAANNVRGPVYLRLGREKTPVMTTLETPFEIGRAQLFRDGEDVAIIACGVEVYEALLAARELEKKKISARVINCPSTKPLDEKTILQAAKECGGVVTAEEHQVHGGLGGAVSETLAQKEPVPMEFVGVKDAFGESGQGNELLKKYGLSSSHIAKAAEKAVSRRK